jgi:MoaA/NifB/PqqE/SkfB family radical SAM enzyme
LVFGLLRKINLKAIENIQSLGIPNLIQHFRGWSPFPVGVVLVLTVRCNLKCEMCLQTEERIGHTPELTLDDMKGVVVDLADSFRFKPFIHLTGGEPLLRKDTASLISHIKAHGFSCSLTTNGLLLEGKAEELVGLGLDRIHVSLDGPPEVHDTVRRVPGAHARAVAGIQAVVAARERLGVSRPSITINTVISDTNLAHLGEMIPVAKKAGADALSYQHLMFSSCTNTGIAPLDVDRLLADIPRLKRRGKTVGLPITFFPRMSNDKLRVYYEGSESELNRKCVFPWFAVRIDQMGNITPCRGFMVDNIKNRGSSLGQVWNGQRFRDYRRELAKLGVYPDCGRCCHRQY